MSDAFEAREQKPNVEADLAHRKWVVNTAVDRLERFDTPESPAVSDDLYAQVAERAKNQEVITTTPLPEQPIQGIASVIEIDGTPQNVADLAARAAELAAPTPVRPAA